MPIKPVILTEADEERLLGVLKELSAAEGKFLDAKALLDDVFIDLERNLGFCDQFVPGHEADAVQRRARRLRELHNQMETGSFAGQISKLRAATWEGRCSASNPNAPKP